MTDWTCAAAVVTGSPHGLSMEELRGYLKRIARARWPDRPGTFWTVSDIVQETLFHAYRDRADFAGSTEGELRSWLRGILLHRVQNLWRMLDAAKRDGGAAIAIDHPAAAAALADSTTASRILMRDEREEMLIRGLERIDEDARDLIIRHHRDGEPLEAIAARLGITRNAVACRLARAREKLGRELRKLQ